MVAMTGLVSVTAGALSCDMMIPPKFSTFKQYRAITKHTALTIPARVARRPQQHARVDRRPAAELDGRTREDQGGGPGLRQAARGGGASAGAGELGVAWRPRR